MLHGKALAVAVAYDMYLECAEEGFLNTEWALDKPADYHTFREKLSLQMLGYDPRKRKYPGDERMRTSTQQPKRKRSVSNASVPGDGFVSRQSFDTASEESEGVPPRLCGDLTVLHRRHIASLEMNLKNGQVCNYCGGVCYTKCGICGVGLHYHPNDGGSCYF